MENLSSAVAQEDSNKNEGVEDNEQRQGTESPKPSEATGSVVNILSVKKEVGEIEFDNEYSDLEFCSLLDDIDRKPKLEELELSESSNSGSGYWTIPALEQIKTEQATEDFCVTSVTTDEDNEDSEDSDWTEELESNKKEHKTTPRSSKVTPPKPKFKREKESKLNCQFCKGVFYGSTDLKIHTQVTHKICLDERGRRRALLFGKNPDPIEFNKVQNAFLSVVNGLISQKLAPKHSTETETSPTVPAATNLSPNQQLPPPTFHTSIWTSTEKSKSTEIVYDDLDDDEDYTPNKVIKRTIASPKKNKAKKTIRKPKSQLIAQDLSETEVKKPEPRLQSPLPVCDNTPLECPQSNSKVKLPVKLKRHLKAVERKENRSNRFACNQCDKTFSFLDSLHYHMRSHTNTEDEDKKSFKCGICGDRFLKWFHLTRHSRIHKNESTFQCSQCPSRFTTNDYLVGHIASVHEESKTVQNSPKGLCGKGCEVSDSTKDGVWLQCNKCNVLFETETLIAEHVRRTHESGSRISDFGADGAESSGSHSMKTDHGDTEPTEPPGSSELNKVTTSQSTKITLKRCSVYITKLDGPDQSSHASRLKSKFVNLFNNIKNVEKPPPPEKKEPRKVSRDRKEAYRDYGDTMLLTPEGHVTFDEDSFHLVGSSCDMEVAETYQEPGLSHMDQDQHVERIPDIKSPQSPQESIIHTPSTSLKPVHACEFCQKTFDTLSILRIHRRCCHKASESELDSCTSPSPLISTSCDRNVPNTSINEASVSTTIQPSTLFLEELPCLFCDMKFSSSNDLIQHYHTHKPTNINECEKIDGFSNPEMVNTILTRGTTQAIIGLKEEPVDPDLFPLLYVKTEYQ